MKIRRYLAKDMRQALNQVRDAQGPDAVILSSRRTEDGVEVVAAMDFEAETVVNEHARNADAPVARQAHAEYATPATPGEFANRMQTVMQASTATQAAHANPSAAKSNYEELHEEPGHVGSELRTLRRLMESQLAILAWNDLTRRAPLQTGLLKELTQLGLSQPLAVEIVAQVPPHLEWHEAQRMALALIAKRINVQGERWLEQGGMVAFVGPTGVGKSTLVAKLAARWVLHHGPRELVLISADAARIGAHDQMQNLGRLLGVPAYTIDQITELGPLLNSVEQCRLVLIDTAGFSQRDQRLAAELALLATSHPRLETALVLSASAQAGMLEEAMLRFTSAAPKSCVFTKVDEATSLGGSLSALARHGLPLAYISEGQRIPEDLMPARAHQMVARAVELARRSGAQADEEVLTLRFGGVAHAIA